MAFLIFEFKGLYIKIDSDNVSAFHVKRVLNKVYFNFYLFNQMVTSE